MISQSFQKTIALLLVALLVAPSALLVAPPRAHALFGSGITFDPTNFVENTISAISNVLDEISNFTSKIANWADYINTYFLQPLAFIMSGNLLKKIAAAVVSFASDGAVNGTGMPQFETNLPAHMRLVGDNQARSFLGQFISTSNSPFASSIHDVLNLDYAQNTSSRGFFDENQSTLGQVSPNVNDYLSGDWSQGGARAWFALTTEDNNNPFMLYQASQRQLGTQVAEAQQTRTTMINWGQGFTSWCGPIDQGDVGTGVPGTEPGDTCLKSDGTWGEIRDPGATVKATLDKAIALPWDKIAMMGDIGPQISSIMSDIQAVMDTVNFAAGLFDGTGGLLGVTQSSGTYPSRLAQFANPPGFLGATQGQVQNTAAASAVLTDMTSQLANVSSAWSIITSMANAASGAATGIVNSCPSQAAQAQYALTGVIGPLLTQANAATAAVTAKQNMLQQVQNELNSGSPAYTADLQTLQAMTPTSADIATAQQQSQYTGASIATPTGSLYVSGGTMVDRATLVNTNAQILRATSCP